MKLSLLFLLVSFCAFSQISEKVYFDFDQFETEFPEFSQGPNDGYYISALYAHCDTTGSVDYNNLLAKQRFDFVYNELKSRGYKFSEKSDLNNAIHGELTAQRSKTYLASDWRRVDILFVKDESGGRANSIESRSQIRSGYAPEPIIETIPESLIEKFVNDSTKSELEFDLTILFVNASVRVLPESVPELERLLEIMQDYPELEATFHGHVCCGPNEEIAEGRARAVSVYLRENGVDTDRLNFIGHSNNQPKVWPERTDHDRKLNRRVAVVFKKINP